jgi:hypothetical protein
LFGRLFGVSWLYIHYKELIKLKDLNCRPVAGDIRHCISVGLCPGISQLVQSSNESITSIDNLSIFMAAHMLFWYTHLFLFTCWTSWRQLKKMDVILSLDLNGVIVDFFSYFWPFHFLKKVWNILLWFDLSLKKLEIWSIILYIENNILNKDKWSKCNVMT